MNNILTISKKGTSRIVEKRSIFIGQAAPVEDEKEAIQFIDEIRRQLADANHHTYAYQIGVNNEIQRAIDGGEPSGTAGRPILEMIKQENLKDVVVVVSRYFGGILLGTGGLVRSYGKAGHLAIIDGKIIEKFYGQKMLTILDYHLLGKVQNYLNESGILMENISYTDKVQIDLIVSLGEIKGIIQEMQDICHGTAAISLGDTGYFTET